MRGPDKDRNSRVDQSIKKVHPVAPEQTTNRTQSTNKAGSTLARQTVSSER